MRVLGLVPARGGSKGVPRKNAKVIAGKPLLAWTAEAALQAPSLDRVILSTDDAEIASLGAAVGLEVPFLRPAALADDAAPMIEVILHALGWADEEGDRFDAVCLLQPTNPLRTAADIEGCIAQLRDEGADTVFSTLPVPNEHHPDWVFLSGDDGTLRLATGGRNPVGRRQDLVPAVHREGSVYVARSEVIRTQRSLYGDIVRGYPIDPARSVNIDTPADWAEAEARLLQTEDR